MSFDLSVTQIKREIFFKMKCPSSLTCLGTLENVSSPRFPGTEQKAFQVKGQTGPNKLL